MIKKGALGSAMRLATAATVSLAVAVGYCGRATARSLPPLRFATASSNWAGYAITGSSRSPVSFQSVSAHWIEPAVMCTGRPGYSGFWVGLGGYHASSRALEQIGTEADCPSSGSPEDFAWYELVPAGPVKLALKVHPGDSIAASVTISGGRVRLSLRDLSTRGSFLTTKRASVIDVSSAEWIAEAPSACQSLTDCRVLPLADFGSVTFSDASARSTTGRTGSISGSAWSLEALELLNLDGGSAPARFGGPGGLVAATPSSLTSNGAAFTVSWQQESAPPRAPLPVGPFDGYRAG